MTTGHLIDTDDTKLYGEPNVFVCFVISVLILNLLCSYFIPFGFYTFGF